MKHLNTFLLLTLALSSSFNNRQTTYFEHSNDWGNKGLKGRVKSFTEEQCRIAKSLGGNRNCKIKQKTTFNAQGYTTQEETWEFSELIEKRIFTYDKNVLHKIESFDKQNALRIIYLLFYDEHGNKVEEKIFSEKNTPDARYTYLYDQNGRKIQMDGYNMKTGGNHFIKEVFTYDKYGNPIKEISEHAAGNSSTESIYKYDNEKRMVEKTEKANYEKSGRYLTTTRYKYDSHGNLVEEDETHNGRKSKTIISLDKTGNWVKRTTTESRDAYLLTERTFEYF